ncbi:MAG: response regulator transcription factor [Syntrophorhabdaceae bacterium]|nr:response regulator transcription factor [Syntrophorhabdaceae bacterium]
MTRFLIADDHALMRRGLIQLLSEDFPDSLFGEAWNAHQIFEKVQEQEWDLVVLDINLPDKSGLDVLKQLKSAHPGLSIFVLSVHKEEEYAVRVLKAGASGYLSKDSAPEELVKAVRKILGGGRYVSPSLGEKLVFELEKGEDAHKMLSDREYQVMLMIASGKSITEIADTFCLSVQSISTYRSRIFEKMGFKNNAELIRYVIDHKLE